ncbi:MAG: hypothetical protein K6B72_09305 [Lachnospiraceae bacterium]|nr:hypothetical protein [Lachnospiraceae bacterium]
MASALGDNAWKLRLGDLIRRPGFETKSLMKPVFHINRVLFHVLSGCIQHHIPIKTIIIGFYRVTNSADLWTFPYEKSKQHLFIGIARMRGLCPAPIKTSKNFFYRDNTVSRPPIKITSRLLL